jgi:flagellar motility protein MotE (MotC chaperone)
MTRRLFAIIALSACGAGLAGLAAGQPKSETQSAVTSATAKGAAVKEQPLKRRSMAADEAAGLELKRQQLAEKEAALAVKEEELKRLSAVIDNRIKELEIRKKALDESLKIKKKVDSERYQKMLKVYKSLKPDQAAGLMDKLEEDIAIEMLSQMDKKTIVKLVPFLNQPRVLKWTMEQVKTR